MVSLFLCLTPLVSFAEPQPPVSLEIRTPDEDSTWERIGEGEGEGEGEEAEHEGNGVAVFLRERPESAIKEALARAVIDAPPCRVFQVIRDSDRLVEFMPYLEARITKNVSTNQEYVCEYLDLPWPIGDRLIALRIDEIQNYHENWCEYLVRWQKDETYGCTVEEAQRAYEDAAVDPVVPPVCEGYWHLLPQDGGTKTLVTYYGFTDPGGKIPPWLQNMFAHSGIVKLLDAVRERATKSDLYPPCDCAPPAAPDSPQALERGAGYLVDSSPRR